MMNLLDLGGVKNYQTFDKYLDQAYLLAFLVVALRWQGPARSIAVGLYVYRLAGFVAFEVSGERDVLLFFPNFFEYWFVLMVAVKHFDRDPFAPSSDSRSLGQRGGEGAGQLPNGAHRVATIEDPSLEKRLLSAATFGVVAAALVALKLFQEYALHYGRWLDGFTAVEAVEAIGRLLTPPY
jgi:hypothetical protein